MVMADNENPNTDDQTNTGVEGNAGDQEARIKGLYPEMEKANAGREEDALKKQADDTDADSTKETKAGETKVEDTENKKAESKAEEPPVDGALKIVAPEGFAIDQEMFGQFSALVAEINEAKEITPEMAQKMADLSFANIQKFLASTEAEHLAQQDGWFSELKKDKEFGLDKFDENVERANRTMRNFATQELIDWLAETGYNKHPGLNRMFAKIDAAFAEDTVVDGKATDGRTDHEKALDNTYPEMAKIRKKLGITT